MKKILCFLILCLFSFNIAVAEEIEILPTMQSKSYVQDRVWVGTFQLVWNDFIDKILHNPVKFPEGTPQSAIELNKQAFDINQITNKSYYKYIGKINKNTKNKIAKAIKRKFKENSSLLDKVDWTVGRERYVVYAMLKKDFEFTNPFDKLGISMFRDKEAEFFGINEDSAEEISDGVKVLFYNNESDFAVVLSTNTNDEVYLYKTATTKPFNYVYSDILKKSKQYQGPKKFKPQDELKIPNLQFFEEISFDELTNKRIKGSNMVIDQAMETIKFKMDNTGVRLTSEAVLTAVTTSLEPMDEPRNFYFDDTFVVFIKEVKKSKPYMALRVHNIEKFQN